MAHTPPLSDAAIRFWAKKLDAQALGYLRNIEQNIPDIDGPGGGIRKFLNRHDMRWDEFASENFHGRLCEARALLCHGAAHQAEEPSFPTDTAPLWDDAPWPRDCVWPSIVEFVGQQIRFNKTSEDRGNRGCLDAALRRFQAPAHVSRSRLYGLLAAEHARLLEQAQAAAEPSGLPLSEALGFALLPPEQRPFWTGAKPKGRAWSAKLTAAVSTPSARALLGVELDQGARSARRARAAFEAHAAGARAARDAALAYDRGDLFLHGAGRWAAVLLDPALRMWFGVSSNQKITSARFSAKLGWTRDKAKAFAADIAAAERADRAKARAEAKLLADEARALRKSLRGKVPASARSALFERGDHGEVLAKPGCASEPASAKAKALLKMAQIDGLVQPSTRHGSGYFSEYRNHDVFDALFDADGRIVAVLFQQRIATPNAYGFDVQKSYGVVCAFPDGRVEASFGGDAVVRRAMRLSKSAKAQGAALLALVPHFDPKTLAVWESCVLERDAAAGPKPKKEPRRFVL